MLSDEQPSDEPDAAAGSGSDDTEWDVESILARRKKNGRIEYKVRWVGFDASEDSWEPEENISAEALELWQVRHRTVGELRPMPTAAMTRSSKRNMQQRHL